MSSVAAHHTPDAPTIHRVGTRALLIDLPHLDTVMAWHGELSAQPLIGQTSAIAAARTVLIRFDSPRATRAAIDTLADVHPAKVVNRRTKEVVIDVEYNGEDLASLAQHMGLTVDQLIERHTGERWVAAFGGFSPGFTYCVPTVHQWDVPRLESPRTSIPAGSVALAANFAAVYPKASPGGWQLIGNTTANMWDSSTDHPALLNPGDVVIYRSVSTTVDRSADYDSPAPMAFPLGTPALRVDSPGMLTIFQDLGRPGWGDIGVNQSGAVDRASALAANEIVGNFSGAGVLENIGGMQLTALVDTVVAVTGALADIAIITPAGRRVPQQLASPIMLPAGARLVFSDATTGTRNYLALRGGFLTHQVLGSVSTDLLSGLGPAPVEPGQILKKGALNTGAVCTTVENPVHPDTATNVSVRVVLGPRHDWFTASEVGRFASLCWRVSGASNRIGLRLEAPSDHPGLTRARDAELASEGMVAGSIQIPPNGLPVVFLADHPVTGGYPVIATVITEDLDKLGQLPAGSTIRFTPVDPDTLETIPLNRTVNYSTPNSQERR